MSLAVYFTVLLAITSSMGNVYTAKKRYLGSSVLINGIQPYLTFVTEEGTALCALDTPWKIWHGHADQCGDACSRLEGCSYYNFKSGDVCELFECLPLVYDVVDGCTGFQRQDTVYTCTPDDSGAIPSRCCAFPFTWNGETNKRCVPKSTEDQTLGCLNDDGQWVTCQEPASYSVLWESTRYGDIRLPVFAINNWIMISNKVSGKSTINFNQTWESYKNGFGMLSLHHDYWIGLEHIHDFTSKHGQVKLRVEIKRKNKDWYYAEYRSFAVGDEASGYQLTVDTTSYHGDASQALDGSNNMKFSTLDRDNDNWADGECATLHNSGWWYNECGTASPLESYGYWDDTDEGVANVIASRLFIKQIQPTID